MSIDTIYQARRKAAEKLAAKQAENKRVAEVEEERKLSKPKRPVLGRAFVKRTPSP